MNPPPPKDWTEADAAALARDLVAARNDKRWLAANDLAAPPDIAAALDVQARVAKSLGGPVPGWKVGIGPGAEPIAAPLIPFLPEGSDFPWRDRLGIEIELAFQLSGDIAARPGRPWTRQDLFGSIDRMLLGVEVTGGRLAEPTAAPFPLLLADSLDNAAYVVGPQVQIDLLDRVTSNEVPLTVSGAIVWNGVTTHPRRDPLEFLLAYANSGRTHLGGLKAGQIVTTGTLCGVLQVPRRGAIDIRLDQNTGMRLVFT